jgi:AcrR family transcriptional regulator
MTPELELTRRARKKEETKERIFKAALKLFRSKGFETATVDEIAAKADVAKGTFFNYFPRKEAVLGYLPELWLEEAEERVAALVAAREPAAKKVRDLFCEFAARYEEDPELSRHIVLEWTRRLNTGDDEICERWDELGERVVRHLQSTGEVRSEVPADRAHQILGAVYHGTLMRWLACPEKPFRLRDEMRARLTLVLEGLAK